MMNDKFWSLVMQFANDLHLLLHQLYKSLANHLTRNRKSLFTVTDTLFFMSHTNTAPLLCFKQNFAAIEQISAEWQISCF